MKTGIVVGRVWSTKRLDELPAGALLEVDLELGPGGGAPERVVAMDPLGCGDGERVLIVQGSVAKGWFGDGKAVIDALIIGSLDEQAESKSAAHQKSSDRSRK